jgi:hypothetical protein
MWSHGTLTKYIYLFSTLYISLLVLGGRRYHVIWLKLCLIHLEVLQLLEKQLQPFTNLRSWIVESPIHQVLQTHFPIPFHVFPTTFSLWVTSSPRRKETQVIDLLIKYKNVFAFSMKDLGRCKTMQFFINLTNETPVYRRRHRLSKHEWDLVDERSKELHEVGLIQPSSSDFTAKYGPCCCMGRHTF